MQLALYLYFNGQCEEALSFYQATLGAELLFMKRFEDAPPQSGAEHKRSPKGVMHASLKIGDGVLLASDGDGTARSHDGFALSISVKDPTEGQRVFDALADGGKVTAPFAKTFWTEGFGMLVDRFDVPWMVNCEH